MCWDDKAAILSLTEIFVGLRSCPSLLQRAQLVYDTSLTMGVPFEALIPYAIILGV